MFGRNYDDGWNLAGEMNREHYLQAANGTLAVILIMQSEMVCRAPSLIPIGWAAPDPAGDDSNVSCCSLHSRAPFLAASSAPNLRPSHTNIIWQTGQLHLSYPLCC